MPSKDGLQELSEVLMDFWLETMRSSKAEFAERIKASDLLARHFLPEGSVRVGHRKGPRRPSTTEVLRLAREMESGNGKD